MPNNQTCSNYIFKECNKCDQIDQHSLAISQYSLVFSY